MITPLPTRKLGKTGVDVTLLGLGGEGVLRTFGRAADAVPLIRRAIDLGITYCDCAHAYAGSEDYYGDALVGGLRDRVFLTSKSAERTRAGAERDLEATLRRMRTDRLDLWQVHDVRTEDDLRRIVGPGGCLEAFAAAKKAGKIRFIGVTGHHDPEVLTKAIELFSFDTILLPVNAAEPHHRSFLDETLPLAVSKQMGVIGMKVLRGFVGPFGPPPVPVQKLLRYAFAQPISTAIIGCDTIAQLEENVAVARIFKEMGESEREEIVESTRERMKMALSYKQGVAW